MMLDRKWGVLMPFFSGFASFSMQISDDERMSLTTAISDDEIDRSSSPVSTRPINSAASFNCTGAVRKAGFLSVKKWLIRKKHKVRPSQGNNAYRVMKLKKFVFSKKWSLKLIYLNERKSFGFLLKNMTLKIQFWHILRIYHQV